jgi:hypothetical protein
LSLSVNGPLAPCPRPFALAAHGHRRPIPFVRQQAYFTPRPRSSIPPRRTEGSPTTRIGREGGKRYRLRNFLWHWPQVLARALKWAASVLVSAEPAT